MVVSYFNSDPQAAATMWPGSHTQTICERVIFELVIFTVIHHIVRLLVGSDIGAKFSIPSTSAYPGSIISLQTIIARVTLRWPIFRPSLRSMARCRVFENINETQVKSAVGIEILTSIQSTVALTLIVGVRISIHSHIFTDATNNVLFGIEMSFIEIAG